MIPLHNSKGRVSLVHTGRSCIWASCESEKICMIHAKVCFLRKRKNNSFLLFLKLIFRLDQTKNCGGRQRISGDVHGNHVAQRRAYNSGHLGGGHKRRNITLGFNGILSSVISDLQFFANFEKISILDFRIKVYKSDNPFRLRVR